MSWEHSSDPGELPGRAGHSGVVKTQRKQQVSLCFSLLHTLKIFVRERIEDRDLDFPLVPHKIPHYLHEWGTLGTLCFLGLHPAMETRQVGPLLIQTVLPKTARDLAMWWWENAPDPYPGVG
jgi:hypothetical protein